MRVGPGYPKTFLGLGLELITNQSYVYANGEPNHSPRFSLRIPDWSVEFKCDVIYCESGKIHFDLIEWNFRIFLEFLFNF